MAFQAHAIPWQTLLPIFKYNPKNSGRPGPQHVDIIAEDTPDQREQLEYFALKFQSTIREHVEIERKRYRPAKEYINRAKSWTFSEVSEPAADTANSLQNGLPEDSVRTSPTVNRKEAKRASKAAPKNWPTGPETRGAYPADFPSKYARSMKFGFDESLHSVNFWVEHVESMKSWAEANDAERTRLDVERKECADVLKLLIEDAASTQHDERRIQLVETLFLIAHHPRIGLRNFMGLGMWCCNINCGVENLVTKTISTFLYLNLLYAIIDNGGSRLAEPTHENERLAKRTSWIFYKIKQLEPRPNYMDFSSWQQLLTSVATNHEYQAECIMSRDYFFPSQDLNEDDNTSDTAIERDPLSDHATFKDFLKAMWKVLIISDMVFTDIGRQVNWEFCVLDALEQLFISRGKGLMGMRWTEYEAGRRSNWAKDTFPGYEWSNFCMWSDVDKPKP